MQGAAPLASPGLNPGGTGFSCGKRVPAGGFASCGAGWGWRCDARRGGAGGVARRPCLAGTRRGLAFLVACLPFYFSLLSCPHPPDPLPGGKGENQSFLMQGASPLASPAFNRLRHLQSLPSRYPVQGEPEVRRKNDRTAFLLAVPAAKERGDRGRWNYPSQATAAFEMVLSPGAGITSAVKKASFLIPSSLHSKYFPFSTRMERKESGEKEEEISSQQVMMTWRPESSRRR